MDIHIPFVHFFLRHINYEIFFMLPVTMMKLHLPPFWCQGIGGVWVYRCPL